MAKGFSKIRDSIRDSLMSSLTVSFFLLVLLVLPFYLNPYHQHVFIMIFLYAYLGGAWNILGGFAGQFSFGHALFFGPGAYTSTLLFAKFGINPWVGLLLGGLMGVGAGLFTGFLSFRYGLKGYYFALVMLGFAEVARVITVNIEITRGAAGLLVPLKGDAPHLFQFIEKLYYYYIALVLMGLMLLVCYLIKKSRLGYFFSCVREDEVAAAALGIKPYRYKMIAIAMSAFFTAMGGTFYAQYVLFIDPELAFGAQVSVEILLPTVIGGLGTIIGPVVGSFFLTTITELTRTVLQAYSGAYLLGYGIILIVVIMFLPHGLMGGLKSLFGQLLAKTLIKETEQ